MIFLKDNEPIKEGTAITVGMFDGVHLGHRALLSALRLAAHDLKTLVFTFRLPDESGSLYTVAEKERLLEQTGLDYAYMQDCSPDFMATARENFILLLKKRYNVQRLVVGEDFRFGKGAQGDASYLMQNAEKFCISVKVVQPVLWDGEKISSTRIRALVASGNVALAAKMLGGYYFASGRVESVNKTGLNFTAANLETPKIKPACGVYATLAEIAGKQYSSVTNVNVSGAASQSGAVNIETNIFDFNSKIYDQVTVYFVERMREEIKFAGPGELHAQIAKDRETAQEILQNAQKQTVYKPETV